MAISVLFLDRDGTLIEEPADQQVDALEKVRLVPDVIPALRELRDHGYRFVMVSNQDGLGTDAFPEAEFRACQDHVLALFASQSIDFDEIFICPHLPEAGCECRKPRAGLLTSYLARTDVDLARSAVIGDRPTDLELAERVGVRGFLLDGSGAHERSWPGIVDALCRAARSATVERSTKETAIRLTVNLDSPAPVAVHTGIGFFDHMLEQIAKHGGFGLSVDCRGDLEVDEHHTVEDVAICLGTALRDALGAKRGIGRYGFVLPMDESEAAVSLDLSGRARFVFEGAFPRDSVGELSTEMVEHFFRSLADTLLAALHIRVRGENTHHMVEACFKAVGRALRQAVARDGSGALPTTKGLLG
ncbi:MAG: bifunctional histidinol-phosphatase/imidazoleglycerol-phosphate dehydratase HisB [Woeseiaceae bacterium]|nr:bifunctional histidinol-phosphatase/imidazoleglycerol-phosphate dehydratase HisB [Woeseiaceae bacterium]